MRKENDPLPAAICSEENIDPRGIREFIDAISETGYALHDVLILRNGKTVFSAAFDPYQKEDTSHLYSISKSWTATAAGFAIQEKLFSLNDKVISFFPDDCPDKISDNLAAMEIKDLLCMASGHDPAPALLRADNKSLENYFFSSPVVHKPGTTFVYNSMATYMISSIIQKLTGKDLIEYLTPRLFEPLGIYDVTWEYAPNGVCFGGWGIHVCAEDLAKLGLLYLNKGVYNGKRLLSEEWVEMATSKQVSNDEPDTAESDNSPDWHQGYGFQMWRCQHNSYRFDGAYGQYMVAIPEKNAIVVVLSNCVLMQPVLDALWTYLYPAFDRPQSEELVEREYICTLPTLNGKEYTNEFLFEKNHLDIKSVSVNTRENGGKLCFAYNNGTSQEVTYSRDSWDKQLLTLCPFYTDTLETPSRQKNCAVGAAGGWDKDILILTVHYRDTPHRLLWTLDTTNKIFTISFPKCDALGSRTPHTFKLK